MKTAAIVFPFFLVLQFCGPSGSTLFLEDFGSNLITFSRCEENGTTIFFDSTLEYFIEKDQFELKGNGPIQTFRLERFAFLPESEGQVVWKTGVGVSPTFSVTQDVLRRAIYTYDDAVCSTDLP